MLNPNRLPREVFGLKAEATLNRITLTPSSVNPGETLYVNIPKLTDDVILGVNMSLSDVHKLSEKDVEKYYVRYQSVMGQQLTDGLVDSGIEAASKTVAYFVPVDDS